LYYAHIPSYTFIVKSTIMIFVLLFVGLFITEIYIAPLQSYYSEASSNLLSLLLLLTVEMIEAVVVVRGVATIVIVEELLVDYSMVNAK